MENRIKNVVNQYAVKSFWFGLIRINTRYDIINESLFHTIRRYSIAVSSFLLPMNGFYSNHNCTSRKKKNKHVCAANIINFNLFNSTIQEAYNFMNNIVWCQWYYPISLNCEHCSISYVCLCQQLKTIMFKHICIS